MSETEGAITLDVLTPFDLTLTVKVLRRRPTHLADILVDGEYRHVLELHGRERLIAVRQKAPNRLLIRALDGPLTARESAEATKAVERMLGPRFDTAAALAALSMDERLFALGSHFAGLKPPRFESLWVTILSVVPFQQVSLEAGIATLNRLLKLLGSRHHADGDTCYGFPRPERLLDCDPIALRACGLSLAKVHTITRTARMIAAGELSESDIERLDDTQAMERLMALPGIGPWSAGLILLRGFRRLGVFPAGDAGASRSLREFFQFSSETPMDAVESVQSRLGPWRGYLYFLLLAWKLLAREQISLPGPGRPA